ncbi:helix-turn-helix transcriptional regulator [Chitinophaga ginsengisegetis]|uniref:AraC family transcriptional regulator n=1 Tax=Chitinophaga ginsengisegetis TaxID=393003 RepID=UPI00342C7F62
MYFTSVPDHTEPGFDEALYFSKFKKHNIIINAESSGSRCDDHVGCLSFKTVLSGEEWYGIDRRRLVIRPGQFLVLNDDQRYSCRTDGNEKVKCLSVFFQKEFASSVFDDMLNSEETLLQYPSSDNKTAPEFFQTLNTITPDLQAQLTGLTTTIENRGYDAAMADERLVFLLRHLIGVHKSEMVRGDKVNAVKATTRKEIYKRLCIARDVLHSSYTENLDLYKISHLACLSVPQLIRQFKAVFHCTPYQYLIRIRLEHAARLLQHTNKPVQEITWICGFENTSAFCRAFKSAYGIQPMIFRKK